MKINSKIFKAYDVRGIYPEEINEEAVYHIAKAYSKHFSIEKVVVASDVRLSSPSLKQALIKGLSENGAKVIDIGVTTTDMMYFATVHLQTDGGIIVSASHNPKEYNGLKMVLKNAHPISSESGIFDLRDLILTDTDLNCNTKSGSISSFDILPFYKEHIKKFIDLEKIGKTSVVANANFGMAGVIAQEIFKDSSIHLTLLNEEPNGAFPKGQPDPLQKENGEETSELIKVSNADLGIAWDADADRCFFYDENGKFILPYYITALLSKIFLRANPNGKIIFDPRLIWAIQDEIKNAGGIPIINKCGHAFIKEKMQEEKAVFGGETSAHYYFKDNFYCDNGMIPFLVVLEELRISGKKMSELVDSYRKKYFTPGEINFKVKNVAETIDTIKSFYESKGGVFNDIDGISFEFPLWRFNLRGSNTEPVIRLNIESRDQKTLEEKIAELNKLITSEN